MTDTEALLLYVAAGNPREDWDALDDRDRWPWRKTALEKCAGLSPPVTVRVCSPRGPQQLVSGSDCSSDAIAGET
jgi:hypothetical protein